MIIKNEHKYTIELTAMQIKLLANAALSYVDNDDLSAEYKPIVSDLFDRFMLLNSIAETQKRYDEAKELYERCYCK